MYKHICICTAGRESQEPASGKG